MSAGSLLPQVLKRHKKSQVAGEKRYEVTPPLVQRPDQSPRQKVIATALERLEPGGVYFLVASPEVKPEEYLPTMRAAHAWGKRFNPPIEFFILPSGFGIVEMTRWAARNAPPILTPEAKTPSTMAPWAQTTINHGR